ncbi:MAG: hypothetical protein AVDCRST_MAG41-2907, partial [uncultured Corynebacteriales bacterium]
AGADPLHVRAELAGRRGPERAGHQRAHFGAGQPAQPDPVQRRGPEQLRVRLRVPRPDPRGLGQREQDGLAGQPPGHVRQAAQGRDVGLVHVVDDDAQRALGRQVQQHRAQRRRGARTGVTAGRTAAPVHPPGPAQELAHHLVRDVVLGGRPGGPQQPGAARGGELPELLEHRGLAGADRPGDHGDRPAGGGRGPGEHLLGQPVEPGRGEAGHLSPGPARAGTGGSPGLPDRFGTSSL